MSSYADCTEHKTKTTDGSCCMCVIKEVAGRQAFLASFIDEAYYKMRGDLLPKLMTYFEEERKKVLDHSIPERLQKRVSLLEKLVDVVRNTLPHYDSDYRRPCGCLLRDHYHGQGAWCDLADALADIEKETP